MTGNRWQMIYAKGLKVENKLILFEKKKYLFCLAFSHARKGEREKLGLQIIETDLLLSVCRTFFALRIISHTRHNPTL